MFHEICCGIQCWYLDGDQYASYEIKPAFTGNVYIGGYFVNGTV